MDILIRAHLEDVSGYGQHVEQTGRQLERLGHRVRFEALSVPGRLPDYFASRLAVSGRADEVVQICPPFLPCPPGAIYGTTWESDRFPAACAAHLAPARLVVVNSRFIRDAVVAAGVAAPVAVVPLGVDPAEYHPSGPPPAACRFGLVANLAHGARRKNVAGAVAAFRLAFPAEADVALALKVGPSDELAAPGDPRIAVIRAFYPAEELRRFYAGLTALVSASMAEGFGLCPLQAMACGRPVIAATYGGHAEYLDAAVGYPVDYTLVEPDWYEGGGHLALPSVESLARQMRRVYEDRPEAAARGARALGCAREFTWDRYGDRLARAAGWAP